MTYLWDCLTDVLSDPRFAEPMDESGSKTVLRCSYTYGFCLPYLGRHMEPHCSAIRRVQLVLADRNTGAVLAEAEFHRPLLAQRPQAEVFGSLLRRMLSRNPEGAAAEQVPNKPAAPKPAIKVQVQGGRDGRDVGEPRRWAANTP